MAPFGNVAIPELSQLLGIKLRSDFGAVTVAFDPGCVTMSGIVFSNFFFGCRLRKLFFSFPTQSRQAFYA
jgi:hypothetical protein